MQLDLFDSFGIENPLKGKRVCLCGQFKMSTKELNTKLRSVGVTDIDRVSDTKEYKEGETVPPAKEFTDFFVVGNNPHEESLKRYELNAHDGYRARMIPEDKLYEMLSGKFGDEDAMPNKVTKQLDLSYDYYNWKAPVINGKEFTSRTASPLNFNDPKKNNPLIEREIYIPEIDGVDMNVLRQLVGNIGAYANSYMDANTYVIMLGDETISKWKNGIQDDTILSIENTYNQSDSKTFNLCFTSLSDFINWITERSNRISDNVTLGLLEKLRL